MRVAFFLFLFLLRVFGADAQVAFRTELLYDQVGVDAAFQVQYNLENAGELTQMRLESTGLFNVIGTYADAHRTSTQINNGISKTTRTYTRTYTFRVSRKGSFTVPTAIAQTADGHTYRSDPATVEVVSGNPRTDNRQGPDPFGQDPFGGMDPFGPDPFGNSGNPFGPGSPLDRVADAFRGVNRLPTAGEAQQNAFLQIVPQKRTALIGEPILVEYRLVAGITVNGNLNKMPAPDGFWVQELLMNGEERGTQQVGNQLYQTLLIKRVALIPQRAGRLPIEPAEMQAVTDVADANGNPQRYTWNIRSAPVSLDVAPLPQEGKPAAFNGAVGAYQITASLEPAIMPRNGSAVLRVTISGEGNLPQLEAPKLTLPEGLSTDEAGVKDAFKTDGQRLLGSRTFTYPLTATKEGHFTLPPVSFAAFNPQSGHYQTSSTQPQTLTVTAAETVEEETNFPTGNSLALWVVLGLVVVGVSMLLAFRKKTPKVPEKTQTVPVKPLPETGPSVASAPPVPTVVTKQPTTLPDIQTALKDWVRVHCGTAYPTADDLVRCGLDALTAQQLPAYLAKAEAARYGGLPVDEAALLEEGRFLLQRLTDRPSPNR